MSVLILQADALALPIADDSVDLVVTSPPYFALRDYTDGGKSLSGQVGAEESPKQFLEALWLATEEMVRVLKPSGSIFVNLGDKYVGSGGHNNSGIGAPPARGPRRYSQTGFGPPKSLMGLPWRYALGCVDDLGLTLRAEIVWSKPNGLPESVLDRVRRQHEQWFHFTTSKKYYANIDNVRDPYAEGTAQRYKAGYKTNKRAEAGQQSTPSVAPGVNYSQNPLGKIPGSVRSVATEALKLPEELNTQHFAAFPQEWPRWFIEGWCPEEGVVLDPFGGTGTTAGVAAALGRTGISVDLSADYCRVAEWRTMCPERTFHKSVERSAQRAAA